MKSMARAKDNPFPRAGNLLFAFHALFLTKKEQIALLLFLKERMALVAFLKRTIPTLLSFIKAKLKSVIKSPNFFLYCKAHS